jgi:hypothetical protein
MVKFLLWTFDHRKFRCEHQQQLQTQTSTSWHHRFGAESFPATFWTNRIFNRYTHWCTVCMPFVSLSHNHPQRQHCHHQNSRKMTTQSPWDFPPNWCIYWSRSINVASPQPRSQSSLSVTAVTAISLYNPSTCAHRCYCLVVVNSIENWRVGIMVCLWVFLFKFNVYDLYFL